MRVEPLVHVGYMKAGSTWLQRFLLDNASWGFSKAVNGSFLYHNVILPNALWYDPDAFRDELHEGIQRVHDRGYTPVISHERLAGASVSGGFDSAMIADRLHELVPQARILIVIREQRSHLLSMYNEYVANGGACSLAGFCCPPAAAKLPLFDLRFLQYHRLIEWYIQRFGRENLLVLPFEVLAADALKFCRLIAEFGGGRVGDDPPTQRVRKSRGAFATGAERWINFGFYRSASNPSAPFRVPAAKRIVAILDKAVPTRMDDWVIERRRKYIAHISAGMYEESNRMSQKYMDLDLKDYGYAVG
jgi:hypothetical protein